MCGSGARWCARADAIFDVVGMHVLDVEVDDLHRLVLTVESGQLEAACPGCGVMAIGHGRRVRVLHDAPSFGRVTLVRWLVRVWPELYRWARSGEIRWWRIALIRGFADIVAG